MNEIIFWTGIWSNGMSRPIGAYQLSYWLRKNNVESQVIDFCQWFSGDEIFNLTAKFISTKTKFIGISTGFWPDDNIPSNIFYAYKKIKNEYPNIKFILGGQRANNKKYSYLADHIIVGEAEDSLLQILKGHNLSPKFDITKLEHRFDIKDCIIEGEVLPLELGRGCVFKCKFCGHHNLGKAKHTYQRNIQSIEDEVTYNYNNFKTEYYHFLDDTVNEDQEKIHKLSCLPKNTGIDIKWNGYLRADLIWRYPESAELLYNSGMRSCFFGIETFHPKASTAIGKGWSGKHAKTFLPKLHTEIWNSEVNLWCNFIIGLPSESEKDLRDTLDWCLENPLGYRKFVVLNLYNLRSDTGSTSEFSKNYKKYGYDIDQNGNWYNDNFTIESAEFLAKEFNQQLSQSNKFSSWNLFDIINCGVPISNGKNLIDNRIRYFKQFKNFLNSYKDKLLKL